MRFRPLRSFASASARARAASSSLASRSNFACAVCLAQSSPKFGSVAIRGIFAGLLTGYLAAGQKDQDRQGHTESHRSSSQARRAAALDGASAAVRWPHRGPAPALLTACQQPTKAHKKETVNASGFAPPEIAITGSPLNTRLHTSRAACLIVTGACLPTPIAALHLAG
jgi:hypothetical protein